MFGYEATREEGREGWSEKGFNASFGTARARDYRLPTWKSVTKRVPEGGDIIERPESC